MTRTMRRNARHNPNGVCLARRKLTSVATLTAWHGKEGSEGARFGGHPDWLVCATMRIRTKRRLTILVHVAAMALTAEQHAQLATAYEKAAADGLAPPQQSCICAKGKLVSYPCSARGEKWPRDTPSRHSSGVAEVKNESSWLGVQTPSCRHEIGAHRTARFGGRPLKEICYGWLLGRPCARARDREYRDRGAWHPARSRPVARAAGDLHRPVHWSALSLVSCAISFKYHPATTVAFP
jgi:hypothetical protein